MASKAARPSKTKKTRLTKKQLAQRKYAAAMRGVRARAAKSPGGKGDIRDRPAARALRKKYGLK